MDHDIIGTIIEVVYVLLIVSILVICQCESVRSSILSQLTYPSKVCPLAKGLSYFLVFGGCAMMIRVFYIAAHNVTGRVFFTDVVQSTFFLKGWVEKGLTCV